MKIFSKIGDTLDKAFNKTIEKLDKLGEAETTVESKEKVYNEKLDTTTTYMKVTKNGKIVEEITVNGRKVDPDSDEGKKVKEDLKKSDEVREEGFKAMDRGFEAMDRAFERMDRIFDKL